MVPRPSLAWAVLALSLTTGVCGSSQRPAALHPRALSHPSDIAVHIIPRGHPEPHLAPRSIDLQPAWDDSFLLSFSSHDTPVTLSLRPSHTLLHPGGIKSVHTHTDENGVRTTETRVMERKEVRAYEGWVLEEGADLDQWIREEAAGVVRDTSLTGWARVVLVPSESDDDELAFQGSFADGNDIFTIHSTPTYLSSRESLDPDPPLLRKRGVYAHPSMVIVRERDTLSPSEQVAALRKRGFAVPAIPTDGSSLSDQATAIGCGHDDLSFNIDPSHPVYEQSLLAQTTTPWAATLFGLPSRNPPFEPRDLSQSLETYAYPPRMRKRQQGDIGGSSGMTSNFAGSIGSTSGCPKQAMVVFVGVAADCTYVANYGSADLARTQILTVFNSASSLYAASFNVSLGIVELNVQSGSCPTSTSQVDAANPWNVGCEEGGAPGINLNTRLSTFSAWRGAKGGADGAGLWHLLTNCSSGSEVGVAWLGQLCKVNAQSSGGQSTSGTGVTAITRSEWQVVAHEIGHNFGAIHDCASGCTLTNSNPVCCPLTASSCDASANFIMSPVSTRNVSTFSACSIGNVCQVLSGSLNTTCLATPGASGNPALISLQSCGNGILEEGEDCDPGSNTDDNCCDATTCKFAPGAVCDPINSGCCSSTCQISSAGTVCRASVDDECDTAEVCPGDSAVCPADAFVSDGTSCGSSLACASGVCTSRTLQCQTAGASLGLSDACPLSASDSCSVTCQDPRSSRSCIVLDQSFRDGTPCGYSGRCENSVCQSGSAIETAKSWYRQNLQISIPVTVVVAIIVILIILALFRCCARKRNNKSAQSMHYGAPPPQNGNRQHRKNQASSNGQAPVYPSQQWNGGRENMNQQSNAPVRYGDGYQAGYSNGGTIPPPPRRTMDQGSNGGWVDPQYYNGQAPRR